MEKVRAILTSLDYGRDGYFFVYDYSGNNVVHPRQLFAPAITGSISPIPMATA